MSFLKTIANTGLSVANNPHGAGLLLLIARGNPAQGYMQTFSANADVRVTGADVEQHLQTAGTIYATQFRALLDLATVLPNSVFSKVDNDAAAATKEAIIAAFGMNLVQQIARACDATVLARSQGV